MNNPQGLRWDGKKRVAVMMRLHPDDAEMVRRLAAESRRTVQGQLEFIVEKHLRWYRERTSLSR
jgi:hypothetical protein